MISTVSVEILLMLTLILVTILETRVEPENQS